MEYKDYLRKYVEAHEESIKQSIGFVDLDLAGMSELDEAFKLAYLFTQYAPSMDSGEFVDLLLKEYLPIDEQDVVDSYFEFIASTGNSDDLFYSDVWDLIEGVSAEEAFRLGLYADWTVNTSDYVRFDGYGNLKGVNASELFNEAMNSFEFQNWYLERNFDDFNCFPFDFDDLYALVRLLACQLVAIGY